MENRNDRQSVSPFLNVFKDGHLVDSFCLDSGDFFVLGRHTNCDVILAHPSISRHHLKIQLLHAAREIVLTDIDSVHGTWIDGEQIRSLTPYTVKEGVTLRLGASSRTYKVQWLHRPLASSINEQSIVPETVLDKEVTHSTLEISTSDPSAAISQAADQIWPARTSDACSNNKKPGCDIWLEDDHSSSCCRHGVPLLHQAWDAVQGGSIGGETFNNVLLQTSNQQQQRGGLPPLPPASRRVPFTPLPPNDASPTIQKKTKSAEKKQIDGDKSIAADSNDKLRKGGGGGENFSAGSRLWLRRCKPGPSPMLGKSAPILQPPDSNMCHHIDKPEKVICQNVDSLAVKSLRIANEQRIQSSGKMMCSNQLALGEENGQARQAANKEVVSRGSDRWNGDQLLTFSLLDEDVTGEEYPSDKENQEPAPPLVGKHREGGMVTDTIDVNRKPFQPLLLTSNDVSRSATSSASYESGCQEDDDGFSARPHSKPSSVVQNLDLILQRLKGMAQSQARHEWHMVVDSTCLLDPKSFKSLKRLQGIKEVRIIIPQIVIRELDFSNRKDKTCLSPHTILRWIETCMLKHPSWIHVQNSSENLPIGASTPPASPHHTPSLCTGAFGELMSPTSGDHVLNCTLVFSTTVSEGQVALLTNDTALKIKAMAEGIICEGATSFCESLLSPYSERFLWAGSVAHRGLQQLTGKSCYHGALEPSNKARGVEHGGGKPLFMSAARGMAPSMKNKHHVVEDLKNHCKQAQGLKVILSKCG